MRGETLAVLLNERFTQPFSIIDSIRQGCPLSTILFIIAIDVLSNLLRQAAIGTHISGVSFEEHGFQVMYGIYVDDIHLFIRDTPEDLQFFSKNCSKYLGGQWPYLQLD